MSEITEISLQGAWRVIVESRNAGWDQRVVAENIESGTQNISGNPGNQMDVYGENGTPWKLRIQHNDGSGWENSWLKSETEQVSDGLITQRILSEDTTTDDSDRDFNDLIIRLEKIGMVEQHARPHAVKPVSLQIMPDGIFEATLDRYYMRVTIRNSWTREWPSNARVGITQRSRNWLANRGVRVVDTWHQKEKEALGQEVINGEVVVGNLDPWQSRTIYFKVSVAEAVPDKHQVELKVNESISHLSKYSKSPMMVTRTTYNPTEGVFRSKCDRGTLVAAIRELSVDYNTLKRAVYEARKLFGKGRKNGSGFEKTDGDKQARCSEEKLEKLRNDLRSFLSGEKTDICQLWSRLQCCCAGGGFGGEGGIRDGDPWIDQSPSGLEVIAIPSHVVYRVEYDESFKGQYGPIPFDDPWWKIALAIVAVILAIAAAASAAADLANKSDDVVIGQVTRTVLNAPKTKPDQSNISVNDSGSVDAAVVELNGERGLTNSIFSYLDAQNNEDNTDAVENIDGHINTNGSIVTNAEINQMFQNIADNPNDSSLLDQLNVFKSGARTGTTKAKLVAGVESISPRKINDNSNYYFINQLDIVDRSDAEVGNSGDSGSLWLTEDNNGNHRIIGLNHAGCTNKDATASRIEDVMNALDIRFQ